LRARSPTEDLDHLLEPLPLGDELLLAGAGLLSHPPETPLGLLQVGQIELGLDRLGIGDRIDQPVRVRHRIIRVRPHDVADRVGLADLGQEPVAEPLALRRTSYEAGDVMELDRLGDQRARLRRGGDGREPLVGHLHDRDVRPYRRERIGGRLGRCRGERVEEGRLAGVGKADDRDLHEA